MAKKALQTPKSRPANTTDWQAQAAAYLQGWQRTQADFANYQKRTEAERTVLGQLAAANTYLKVAPVLNDIRRAKRHLPDGPGRAAWETGLTQIEQHFLTILQQANLVPIDAVAGAFDPRLHEAIVYEDHPELADGSVTEIVEIGWRLGDRVLQPAKVRVSRGQTAQSEVRNQKLEEV